MTHYLEADKDDLYLLRYSGMCKPACEVANLTQLESHTTRARTMIMWRAAAGHIQWGLREVEIMYQSTLDSISEAFDIFHYPISRYMLDGRAEIWEAGLAPLSVREAVTCGIQEPLPNVTGENTLLLAGEGSISGDRSLIENLRMVLKLAKITGAVWTVPTGALAYSLGARAEARRQAEIVVAGIRAANVKTVIADGPETAWALQKIVPALGLSLPNGVVVRLLSEVIAKNVKPGLRQAGKVFFHDSRPAYFLAEKLPNHRAILTGSRPEEPDFGEGLVYTAPRKVLEGLGLKFVTGTWVRGLAKSCGADDGLWLTYPDLAKGLAQQRLEYASYLKADWIVTDSPLCALWLSRCRNSNSPEVHWLPDLLLG